MTLPDDALADRWMQEALALAHHAGRLGEVPVGAIVVDADGVVIGRGANQPIGTCDPTAHAEIVAIRNAAQTVGNYRLADCTLVVTLEPCAMCAGAISHARIRRVIYGASDPKGGAIDYGPRLFSQPTIHHRPEVVSGIGATEASDLLKSFFAARRGGRM